MSNDVSPTSSLNIAANVIAVLDSELRLKIILELSKQPHAVHELVSKLNKSQPLVSQHLRVLKRGGIVTCSRNGRQVSYQLAIPEILDLIRMAADIGNRSVDQEAECLSIGGQD